MRQFDKISLALATPPALRVAGTEDEAFDVMALFRIVRRRIWMMLLVVVLVCAVAFPLILNTKRVYVATTRLLIQDPLITELAASELAPEAQLNLTTELERLLSRDVSVRMIRDLGLDRKPEFNPSLRETTGVETVVQTLRGFLSSPPNASGKPGDPIDQILPEYLGRLGVSRVSGSEIINIEFKSQDPELAAAVANALIRVYLEVREEQFQNRVASAEDWLQLRIRDQQGRTSTAIDAARRFHDSAERISSDPAGISAEITELARRRAELSRLRVDGDTALARLRAVAGSDQAATAIATPAMRELAPALLLQQARLDRLLETYGQNHPDVAAARATLADTEAAIAGEIARRDQELTTELAAFAREEKAIAQRLRDADAALIRARGIEAEGAELQHRADVEQAALDRFGEQIRTLRADAVLPVAELEVLSPASVPLSPTGRGRSFYLLATFFAASCLAVTAALLREILDHSIRSHDQVQKIAGTLSAGMVPTLPARRLWGHARAARPQRDALFAEAVRETIISLERSHNGTFPRCLLVTSALPNEGKTTLSVALAVALSASGHQVLLVDGDMHRGRVHVIFGGDAEPGLAEYVSGKAKLSEVIRHDPYSGVDFIPSGAGRSASRPVPALDRTLVKDLIQSANQEGKIVIFDSAPALATSETPLLASFATDTLIVARWGKTNRSVLEAAVRRIQIWANHAVHVTVNRVNLKRQALYGFSDAGVAASTLQHYHR